jgi:hypothetical protein
VFKEALRPKHISSLGVNFGESTTSMYMTGNFFSVCCDKAAAHLGDPSSL